MNGLELLQALRMWRSSFVISVPVRTRDRTWFIELSDKGMYSLDILIQSSLFKSIVLK